MRESQVHFGIQHSTYDHVLQCEISVQCIAQYIVCEGNRQATQDEKHAKQVSCGADVSYTITTDRSQDSRGTAGKRPNKVLFMEFVKK